MTKINLKTGHDSAKDSRQKKNRSSNKSIIFGVVLLLLSFGVYGGMLLMNKAKEKEKEKIDQETLSIEKQMDEEKYQEVYDFEGRLSELEKIVSTKTLQQPVLNKLSQHTLETTRYKTLSVKKSADELMLSLALVIPNLDELSKQAEAYSKLEDMNNVSIISAAPYAEGDQSGIEAKLELTMQDQKIH